MLLAGISPSNRRVGRITAVISLVLSPLRAHTFALRLDLFL